MAFLILCTAFARANNLEDLIDQLKDKDPVKRYEAAVELGKLGDPAAIPALMEALSDEDKYVSYWAASSLGDLKALEAVPVLVENLNSEDELTRYWSSIALGRIEDLSAYEPLQEAYRKEKVLNTKIGMEIAIDKLDWIKKQAGGDEVASTPTPKPTEGPVISPTEGPVEETPTPEPVEETPTPCFKSCRGNSRS